MICFAQTCGREKIVPPASRFRDPFIKPISSIYHTLVNHPAVELQCSPLMESLSIPPIQ
jgi:hypothetical protein